MIETLTWKGLNYTVKPFTLGNYYSVIEAVSNASADGDLSLTLMFKNTCKAMLKGVTAESQSFLVTDNLAMSILNEEEDVLGASNFKERLDEIRANFIERANALKTSAPDLTDKLQAAEAKALRPKSPKAIKAEQGHSG